MFHVRKKINVNIRFLLLQCLLSFFILFEDVKVSSLALGFRLLRIRQINICSVRKNKANCSTKRDERKVTKQQLGWKKGLYLENDKEKEELQKEVFSTDLTISFVLVTVLSVLVAGPYRFKGDFWVPMCIESLMGWLSWYVPRYLLSPAVSAVKIPCYIVGIKGKKKGGVCLKNTRTCGGTADVLIAARDWLFFSQTRGT